MKRCLKLLQVGCNCRFTKTYKRYLKKIETSLLKCNKFFIKM